MFMRLRASTYQPIVQLLIFQCTYLPCETDDTEDANEEDAAAEDSANNYSFEVGPEDMPAGAIISIMAIVTIIVLAIVAFALALDAFIFNPLELGCQRYFFKNLDEDAKFSNVVFAFDHSYKNIAKTMFLRDLYIVLWSLLFVIPGIIKSYEYRMIIFLQIIQRCQQKKYLQSLRDL